MEEVYVIGILKGLPNKTAAKKWAVSERGGQVSGEVIGHEHVYFLSNQDACIQLLGIKLSSAFCILTCNGGAGPFFGSPI